jgi:hypothetical protein
MTFCAFYVYVNRNYIMISIRKLAGLAYLEGILGRAGLPTQQDDHTVRLGGDET